MAGPARSRRARWAPTARCRRFSDTAPPLFSYFKQRFAQVTNPAIDSLREDLVMSLTTWLGPRAALLDDAPPPGRRLRLPISGARAPRT